MSCFIFVLAPVISNAGTIRHDIDPAIYTYLGGLPIFDSVGLIEGQGTGIGDYVCSGTLVASSWALTAGHCIDQATSLDFSVGGTTYSADAWEYHPGWLPGNILNLIIGNDLGMVHLSQPVQNVTPAKRYTGFDEVGKIGLYAGFGSTGTGLTGSTTLDLQKRVGANAIDSYFFGDALTSRDFLADFDNPLDPTDSLLGSPDPLSIEYLIAGGDSGGAVFLESAGELLLGGVHSFVLGTDLVPDSDYGDIAGSTRVAPYNDWIDSLLALPASFSTAQGGATLQIPGSNQFAMVMDPAPGSTNAVPEPPAGALVLSGLLALLLSATRRRRQHQQPRY